MIALRVSSDLDKMVKALDRQSAQVQRAIVQGLNEGGDKVRTQVRKAMREQTGLLQLKSVTSREGTMRAFGGAPRTGIGPVGPGSLSYTIVYRGKPHTKPDEFRLSVRAGPGGGVTAWMWGVPHKFKRSFQYWGGLRMRLGRDRLPIRGFDGPNLAKEAVKGEVAETFLAQSQALVPPIIEKRLARAL